VPNININNDGDFNFNLDNFENTWNENNIILCFSDSNDFSPFLAGSFVFETFLPTAKHAAYFVEQKNKLAVNFIIYDFVFPRYLQKKFKQI